MELLTTAGQSHQIEQLIKGANSHIWLISPYLKIHKSLFEKLKKADARQVKITLVYGKNDLQAEQQADLEQLQNCEVYFCKNLHAKAYLNETFGIIGSMNLYEFSQINNIEFGALFTKKEDKEFYENTVDEISSLIDISEQKQEIKPNSTPTYTQQQRQDRAIQFYSSLRDVLANVQVSLDVLSETSTRVSFTAVHPENKDIIFSNGWGFITVYSEEEQISDEIRDKAKKISSAIDSGNRFYNHRHANRFCIYDPKFSGDESYLDDGDAEVIREIVKIF